MVMRWDGITITNGMVMGWDGMGRGISFHHKLPFHHHHCDLYNPSIASWWYVCIISTHQLPVGGMSALYHPIDFPIPPPGVASHPIHNSPLELSTIPPHTHIQSPRYHRTAIIFLDISRKAGLPHSICTFCLLLVHTCYDDWP